MRAEWWVNHGDPGAARTARVSFRTFMRTRRLGAQAFDLEIAFGELLASAMVHGADPAVLRLAVDRNRVVLSVEDVGHGFNADSNGAVPSLPESDAALGLIILRALADHIEFSRSETGRFGVVVTITLWDAPFGDPNLPRRRALQREVHRYFAGEN
jgi:anti-sigma regulatory factor (Ser/Thr protein kinase)